MSRLSPALDAELRSNAPIVFGAIAIDMPEGRLGLLDGAGSLTFAGRTFVGEDPVFGVLSEVENLTDGGSDDAPAFGMTLLTGSDAAAATLAAPAMQGSPVLVWIGAVDRISGLPIDPELIFTGELDVPKLTSDTQGRRLDYEVVSVFERLFEGDESARLSSGHHRSLFPNEAGLDFVTGVTEPVYWGVAGNPSSVTTYPGGGYGGGGGDYGGREAEVAR
ncbi:MAG: hypothetical protein FJ335_05270 [Sphingomonadales bacterium]|nr:hypothetical protein [Sphingomonadales bacterium]